MDNVCETIWKVFQLHCSHRCQFSTYKAKCNPKSLQKFEIKNPQYSVDLHLIRTFCLVISQCLCSKKVLREQCLHSDEVVRKLYQYLYERAIDKVFLFHCDRRLSNFGNLLWAKITGTLSRHLLNDQIIQIFWKTHTGTF